MTRYKGRRSAKAIERQYPYWVDIPIPEGGLGRRLNQMHDWHQARGIESRHGSGRREGTQDYSRWCFADQETADAFAAEFK